MSETRSCRCSLEALVGPQEPNKRSSSRLRHMDTRCTSLRRKRTALMSTTNGTSLNWRKTSRRCYRSTIDFQLTVLIRSRTSSSNSKSILRWSRSSFPRFVRGVYKGSSQGQHLKTINFISKVWLISSPNLRLPFLQVIFCQINKRRKIQREGTQPEKQQSSWNRLLLALKLAMVSITKIRHVRESAFQCQDPRSWL